MNNLFNQIKNKINGQQDNIERLYLDKSEYYSIPLDGEPFVITVAGSAGCGKTTFIEQASTQLIDKMQIIHLVDEGELFNKIYHQTLEPNVNTVFSIDKNSLAGCISQNDNLQKIMDSDLFEPVASTLINNLTLNKQNFVAYSCLNNNTDLSSVLLNKILFKKIIEHNNPKLLIVRHLHYLEGLLNNPIFNPTKISVETIIQTLKDKKTSIAFEVLEPKQWLTEAIYNSYTNNKVFNITMKSHFVATGTPDEVSFYEKHLSKLKNFQVGEAYINYKLRVHLAHNDTKPKIYDKIPTIIKLPTYLKEVIEAQHYDSTLQTVEKIMQKTKI